MFRFVINGKFTVKQELGEDMDIHGAAYNLQGGQYKQMVEKKFVNFCNTVYMNTNKFIFENYQSHTTNPVEWKTCGYPAGSNEVKNFLVDDNVFPLPPYVPGGEKWKIEIRMVRAGEVLGGYDIYANLRSNETLLGWK